MIKNNFNEFNDDEFNFNELKYNSLLIDELIQEVIFELEHNKKFPSSNEPTKEYTSRLVS